MTNAERKAAAQRKARDAAERATRKDLAAAYGDAWRRIRERIDALAAEMAEARKAGRTIRPSWLYEERRLERLAQGIEAEFGTFIDLSTRRITDEQMQAAITGRDDAADLIRASLPQSAGFTPAFPTVPFEEMVGRLSSGATLGQHLGAIVPTTAIEGVKRALLQGIALGQNPRKVARAMRDAGGLPLARALTIARTETLGVYREATRQTFAANSDVLTGWEWHSALDKRTCPVCWSMHGTMHRPDESLDSHPSCRCAMLPVSKTWKELGFEGVPETRVTLEKGEDIFARQSEALQRAVLGPGKFTAYKEGRLTLRDTVMKTRSTKWGPGRRERSLRSINARKASGK